MRPILAFGVVIGCIISVRHVCAVAIHKKMLVYVCRRAALEIPGRVNPPHATNLPPENLLSLNLCLPPLKSRAVQMTILPCSLLIKCSTRLLIRVKVTVGSRTQMRRQNTQCTQRHERWTGEQGYGMNETCVYKCKTLPIDWSYSTSKHKALDLCQTRQY